MKKVDLIIVDPQYDFCDPNGALYVSNAENDMQRISKMIIDNVHKISNLSVTLDQHHNFQIFHPIFWENKFKKNPKPLTSITLDDLEKRIWLPSDIKLLGWCEHYLKCLHDNGEYNLTIWPTHCIIGTLGSTIVDPINTAIVYYETENTRPAHLFRKGEHYLTEHYSAIQANVPILTEKSTQPDKKFLALMNGSDAIIIAGEALSHCVASTVMDIAKLTGDLSKVILLTDASSTVVGFEELGDKFLAEAVALGMRTSTTDKIFQELSFE